MKKKVGGKSRKLSRKITATAIAVAAATAGTYFLLSNGGKLPLRVPAYHAWRVIDGDTFETTEHQLIRVQSTEAPELDMCGGPKAKEALEKLIMGKPLYLKVTYRDPFNRLVSLVYTKDKFINQEMLSNGYSYHARSSPGEIGKQLSKAGTQAWKNKKGVFGSSCTQVVNKNNPSCNIKGNNRDDKIYYLPSCGVYKNVEVQLYLGDQWFCTEKEAQKAGYRRPAQCP